MEKIKKLRRSEEEEKVVAIAHQIGLAATYIRLKSSASGEYIETAFGRLEHTNGHFTLSGVPNRTFWFREISPLAGHIVQAGDAATCSVAAFNVSWLEEEIRKLLKNC